MIPRSCTIIRLAAVSGVLLQVSFCVSELVCAKHEHHCVRSFINATPGWQGCDGGECLRSCTVRPVYLKLHLKCKNVDGNRYAARDSNTMRKRKGSRLHCARSCISTRQSCSVLVPDVLFPFATFLQGQVSERLMIVPWRLWFRLVQASALLFRRLVSGNPADVVVACPPAWVPKKKVYLVGR